MLQYRNLNYARSGAFSFGQGWGNQNRDGDDGRGEALGAAVIVVRAVRDGGT